MVEESDNLETSFNLRNRKLARFYCSPARNEESQDSLSYPLFDNLVKTSERYGNSQEYAIGGEKQITKATDRQTGRTIAIARVHPDRGSDPRHIEHFLREARLTANLQHPNIVPVHDIGIDKNNSPYFSMKLIGGSSLSEIIKNLRKRHPEYTKRYPLPVLLDIFVKICDAIAFAHSKKVIHLDLKPDNIQVGEFGEVLVCDWGIAKVIGSADDGTGGENELDPVLFNDITLSGDIKGTPGFMAPEQIDQSIAQKAEKTDIYSLGALLYTILTLHPPLHHLPLKEILTKTKMGDIPDPDRAYPEMQIPFSLTAVCKKAMATRPGARYNSVQDIISDVQSYLQGFATKAEEAGFLKAFYLLFQRHKAVTLLLIVILTTAISMGYIIQQKHITVLKSSAQYQKESRLRKLFISYTAETASRDLKKNFYNNSRQQNWIIIESLMESGQNNENILPFKLLLHFIEQDFEAVIATYEKFPNKAIYSYLAKEANKYRNSPKSNGILGPDDFGHLAAGLYQRQHKWIISDILDYILEKISDDRLAATYIRKALKVFNPELKKEFFMNFQRRDEDISLSLAGNREVKNIQPLSNLQITHLNLAGSGVDDAWRLKSMPVVSLNIAGLKLKNMQVLREHPTLKSLTLPKATPRTRRLIRELREKGIYVVEE